MDIITNLKNGNLSPYDNFGRDNPELLKYEAECEKLKEKLANKLEGDLLNLFSDYLTLSEKYQLVCEEQSFHDGFCIGTKISAEAFLCCEKILK